MVYFANNSSGITNKSLQELKSLLKRKSRRIKGRKSIFTFVTLKGGETRYFPIPCTRTKTSIWVTKQTVKYLLTNFMFYF